MCGDRHAVWRPSRRLASLSCPPHSPLNSSFFQLRLQGLCGFCPSEETFCQLHARFRKTQPFVEITPLPQGPPQQHPPWDPWDPWASHLSRPRELWLLLLWAPSGPSAPLLWVTSPLRHHLLLLPATWLFSLLPFRQFSWRETLRHFRPQKTRNALLQPSVPVAADGLPREPQASAFSSFELRPQLSLHPRCFPNPPQESPALESLESWHRGAV
mmetsp:Transcript_9255/g.20523  ORF Transcript_9255/g.20523 Transcript_9255/m.20523 type:complete len:214 (-) Transcript_9255:3-644(-)